MPTKCCCLLQKKLTKREIKKVKNYKIIYYIGDSIRLKTTIKKGTLTDENGNMLLTSKNEQISLNMIYSAELIKLNGLGTMIKIVSDKKTIFLAAYRMYLNIGTGFAIINYLGTINIKKRLDAITKVKN